MAAQNTELARRLVACPHFRWMPGMLCMPGKSSHEGGRYLGEHPPGSEAHNVGFADGTAAHKVNSWLPDLDDPATVGCVLALVREAWRAPFASVHRVAWGWVVVGRCDGDLDKSELGHGPSEAAALLAALVGAPAHSSALEDPSSSATSDAGR